MIHQFQPDGLGIVGGETAFHLLRGLGAGTLKVLGRMAEVISYGVMVDGSMSGRSIVTKGGSVGPSDSIVKMLHLLKYGEKQNK
jgi:uncharacterized protein YgbK (DUF1537 family)